MTSGGGWGGGIDWQHLVNSVSAGLKIGQGMPGYKAPAPAAPAPTYSSADQYNTGVGTPGYRNGQALLGPLNLPKTVNASDQFTWQVDTSGNNRTLTTMTLAGSLSWLRWQSVHNKKLYNEIIGGLVRAGYVTPSEARYNGYTSAMAGKFLQSAIDVEQTNNDAGNKANNGGAVTTWWNHIDALAQGREAAGQLDPNTGLPTSGSGGGGGGAPPAPPTRTDTYTNPADVKSALNTAAMSVLGRHLDPKEVASFQSAFHAQEEKANAQSYQQQLDSFNNKATSPALVNAPTASAAAENYVDTNPALADDRTNSLVGSYLGVLRNMTGLGAGGVSSAVS